MEEKKRQNLILALGLLFAGIFLAGTLLPQPMWGTHFLAFLPAPTAIVVGALCLSLMMLGWFLAKKEPVTTNVSRFHKQLKWGIPLFAGLIMGILFMAFPMVADIYGDSYKYTSRLDRTIPFLTDQVHKNVFSFDFSPYSGEKTTYGIICYLSYYLDIPIKTAFYMLNVSCGILFSICWTLLVFRWTDSLTIRICLTLLGLFAPFMLNFYGHIELYSPAYLVILLYFFLLLESITRVSFRWLAASFILLLASIKFHSSSNLLIIPWALSLLHLLAEARFPGLKRFFTWKHASVLVLLPVILTGAFLYFFVFKDHANPRTLQGNTELYSRVFLPILRPEPPYNRYSLLGAAHFLDFFNLILFWSPAILLTIVSAFLFYRKQIKWQNPLLIISGTTLILYVSFFFMLNPLLSMPMDWDLMSIPAIPAFVFILILLSRLEKQTDIGQLVISCIALTALTIPVLPIHSNQSLLSKRLEILGIWNFKTNYEWSARNIEYALSLSKEGAYVEQKDKILDELRPYAIEGNDLEFARLLKGSGTYSLTNTQDPKRALTYLNEAESYFPENPPLWMDLVNTHFRSENYPAAFHYAEKLVKNHHPSQEESLRIAVQCALEAEFYKDAERYARELWMLNPEHELTNKILYGLEHKKDRDQLKFLLRE